MSLLQAVRFRLFALHYKRIVRMFPEVEDYSLFSFWHAVDKRRKKIHCSSMSGYLRLLDSDPEEREYVRKNLTFNGTHFFRGEDWEVFNRECLSRFAGKERVDIWCAGCSSGEEAYSVIASLMDYVPPDRIFVLATDYNDMLLEKCREGSYFNMHYEEIPAKYRHYVTRGEKKFVFREDIRGRITVKNLNLLTDDYPTGFDIVICRNVIKFFREDRRREIKEKLALCINPGGFLFTSSDQNSLEYIDSPESLGLEQVDGRCIYRKR